MNDCNLLPPSSLAAVCAPPIRLLVIDDQLAELQLLIGYLDDYQFDIFLAENGHEGLSRAVKERPDLILLDLHMPPPDGFALLQALKNSAVTRAIPVLVLSGRADVDTKIRSFQLGAIDYLVKPVHEEELRARVTVQFHNARLQLALQRRLQAYEARYGPAEPEPTDFPANRPPRREVAQLMKVRQILQERLADPPSLPELARMVGTNQPQLSQGFRTLFGTTVFGFLREVRLQRARQLLITTNLPVKTIALEVGYRNSGDLTRSVKERFGMNPTALRLSG